MTAPKYRLQSPVCGMFVRCLNRKPMVAMQKGVLVPLFHFHGRKRFGNDIDLLFNPFLFHQHPPEFGAKTLHGVEPVVFTSMQSFAIPFLVNLLRSFVVTGEKVQIQN